MICEECKKSEQKSIVYPGVCQRTLNYCPPYYSEDGKYHVHDSNRIVQEFTCSNGHHWSIRLSYPPCPTCGNSW